MEFNILVAKIGAVFEKNEVPKRSTMRQRTEIRREVKTELVMARKEKQPPNIVAETITQIADKERKKAIGKGDCCHDRDSSISCGASEQTALLS